MKPLIRRVFCWLKYKLCYPGNRIASTATLSKAISLAPGVSVGAFASISNASLGRDTIIQAHCSVREIATEDHVAVYSRSFLEEVEVGRFSYISSSAAIAKTRIGRFCSIGPDLICGYGDHPVGWISTSPVFFSTLQQCGVSFSKVDLFEEHKPIAIGHDVWIGARVFIRGGVTIGSGAIIAAGAVVVKDVPGYAVVGGVPAKVIRYRFTAKEIDQLNDLAWWNWPEEKLRAMQELFAQGDLRVLSEACSKRVL